MKKNTARRTIYYYGRTVLKHWPFFFLGILTSFGYTYCLTFLNAQAVSKIIDQVSEGNVAKEKVLITFLPAIILLVLANVVGQICSKLQDYAVWKLEILGYYDLSTLVFDSLSNQSMTFHNSRFGGTLVSQTSKFTNAFSSLVELFNYSLVPLISATVLTLVLLAPLVPLYVIILAIILVIYVVVVWLLFRRTLPLNTIAAGAQNRLSGELSDSITNILAVKTSGRENYEKELFTSANKEVRLADSRRMHATLLSASVAAGIIVVIMIIQTVFVAGGNAWYGISAGTLILIFSYTHNLTLRFNMINQTMTVINRAFGDAGAMTQNLDEPRLVADDEDAVDLKVTEGRITFEHLSFQYADGRSEDIPFDEEPVAAGSRENIFTDFSMSIEPGERIGLVGRSGSGKTTLTKLLLRLEDIQEGRIRIDGQDVSKVTQVSLRRQIAYVPQEPLLFHRTIAENIAYGRPDASFEEIRDAAGKANALEFIEKLADGFDTITGERGVMLSGGQRQRIVIARAILTNAPILVLDEATSALDSESEKMIQDALANLMQGRTSIVIAHRLSTVSSLDRIIVLKDGVITEDGSHEELVKKGGEYATLWERQTGAF